MGNERRLVWEPLRAEFKRNRLHAQRFEDKLSLGIPDVNVHVPGCGDVWIELKHVNALTPRVNIGLRREQYIWLREAHYAGRDCLLLARIADEWYAWKDPTSWVLAKKPCLWSELQPYSKMFKNTVAFVDALQKNCGII